MLFKTSHGLLEKEHLDNPRTNEKFDFFHIMVVANEDTMLQTQNLCSRHKKILSRVQD